MPPATIWEIFNISTGYKVRVVDCSAGNYRAIDLEVPDRHNLCELVGLLKEKADARKVPFKWEDNTHEKNLHIELP